MARIYPDFNPADVMFIQRPQKPTLIILHETWVHSVVKDAFSVGSLIVAVGAGIWLDSLVLQWVGLVLWFGFLAGLLKTRTRNFTPDEAHAEIDRIETASLFAASKDR